MEKQTWNTSVYVRISKDDGDSESQSIQNQKDLILNFLKDKKEFNVISIKSDDGYSGVNFNRPAFIEMEQDIRVGKIDCIIVKDLSRLGRDYIQTGYYIENVFPFLNVRFISINDNFDSCDEKSIQNDLLIPIKNLFNDAYSRDISVKTRSQLATKRKNGDYVGAFVSYGYRKSEVDKHKIEVDPYASNIVKMIFEYKLNGLSNVQIAEGLNKQGVFSPAEYKYSIDKKYFSGFKKNGKATWDHSAIGRILRNEIHIGNLIQGKTTTANHKIEKRTRSPNVIRIENAHEQIISTNDFEIVQKMLNSDTRVSTITRVLPLFSSLLICADCGRNMIRKTVPRTNKKDIYYVCASNKMDKNECASHLIREDKLYQGILVSIKQHIDTVIGAKEMLQNSTIEAKQANRMNVLEKTLMQNTDIMSKNITYKNNLYRDLQEDIISSDDFKFYNEEFSKTIRQLEHQINEIQNQIEMVERSSAKVSWIKKVENYYPVVELNRKMLLRLIHKIKVNENKTIEVIYAYQDELYTALSFCNTEEVRNYG